MKKMVMKIATIIYILSVISFCSMGVHRAGSSQSGSFKVSTTEVGAMCISTVYPAMNIELADSRDNENVVIESESTSNKEDTDTDSEADTTTDETAKDSASVTGTDPKVLIVHTHATESYMPASDGNFHSKEEANTVREVGNMLAETLEANGISVVHDTTLHDYPSYNSSYSRSYETVEALLAKYPTIECVIDLHRDAISSESSAATVTYDGEKCAKYSYVVGTGASTTESNKAFISTLNSIAKESYDNFTGNVLERGYKYNQDLCTKYLLVEIGYNRNDISEARNTAKIFASILAKGLSG
jgi:stage II sporulation protein P